MANEIKWPKEIKENKEPGETVEENPEQARLEFTMDSVKEALEKIEEGKIEEAREIIDTLRLLHPVQLERVLSSYPSTEAYFNRVGIKTKKPESRIGLLDHTPEIRGISADSTDRGPQSEDDDIRRRIDAILSPQSTTTPYHNDSTLTGPETDAEDVMVDSQGMVDELRRSVDDVFGPSSTSSKKKL